ncbi:hypothetical protein TCAL_02728 [Tigriopus californicus]|uniref:Cystatin domain-containing protein n=1 Tax=Tigriopus californicus TaxID=6832 RepID=A0A553NQ92_TIGCA|nr:cystatin-B-like [Tigriopus californicus]XP_059082306.1 cystatin-B-like [Tigriopus californicus]TRY67612.1 hypothetical protein TCAL_02728 [Tigriopus californicus]|eukprot:TCALIF_02728-PA protein Name:"Similar to Cstb Cystatin-B (Rattus norvegicus)" AED:0.02 eAED:0.02 QI:0/1/0.5/1/1/1/2/80/95
MICGGMGTPTPATPEIQEVCDKVKPHIEEKMGQKLDTFEAKSFTSQVVAGSNYFVKIHVGDDKCVHARIFKDLQKNISLSDVQKDKSHEDEIAYF